MAIIGEKKKGFFGFFKKAGNRIAELKQEGNISDDEAASYVETNVPPEEPVGGEDAQHSEEIPPQE